MKLEAPLRTSDSELVALLQEVPVHPLFPASPASWRSTGFGWRWQNKFPGLFAGCPEKVGPRSSQAAKPPQVLQRLRSKYLCSAPLRTRSLWLRYQSPEHAPDDTFHRLGVAFRFQDPYSQTSASASFMPGTSFWGLICLHDTVSPPSLLQWSTDLNIRQSL